MIYFYSIFASNVPRGTFITDVMLNQIIKQISSTWNI